MFCISSCSLVVDMLSVSDVSVLCPEYLPLPSESIMYEDDIPDAVMDMEDISDERFWHCLPEASK